MMKIKYDSITVLSESRQDYIYVKKEYQSTLQNMKNYLRYENNVNENHVLSYCETLKYISKHD